MESSNGGTGQGSPPPPTTTHCELLTVPETLQKIETSIRWETLPPYLESCLLRTHLLHLLYLPSCYRESFLLPLKRLTPPHMLWTPCPLTQELFFLFSLLHLPLFPVFTQSLH